MPTAVTRRRLATVLFVDIVGSTALASRIGDRRWRDLLSRFHRIVRDEIRRHRGRLQDTAGDGVLATFGEPALAIEAAVAIVDAVHELGLDVRAGIHTGECGEIDGKLQGIAVSIGARVVSLAGPAELFATSTVKDLVVGSGVTFEERGTHELKGVDGRWPVYAVRGVATRPLPEPLAADEAVARVEALSTPRRTWRDKRIVLAAVAVPLLAAAVLVPLLLNGGGKGRATFVAPISLVRIDAHAARVGAVRRGGPYGGGHWGALWSANGTLWQLVGQQHGRLVQRRVPSGRVVQTFQLGLDACSCRVAFGFGSVWVASDAVILKGPKAGETRVRLDRIDELSGRRLARLELSGDVFSGTVATGNRAVWVLESDGTLVRVDPLSNRVTGRYDTHAIETHTLVPVAGYDWICECVVNKVMRFDPRTHRAKTFSIPEQAEIVGLDSTDGETLWLFDAQGATLTPMNPATGKTGTPLGLGGQPTQAVTAFGDVWAAAGGVVDRVDLATKERRVIVMPPGVWAGSIAADPATGSIWVGNSFSPPPPS